MAVTVSVNDLTLCHKGSNGVARATMPDVCKTPAPGSPVPIPYPNKAVSGDLAKGTTTVMADGGNMCANDGSEFSCSTGDEPGSVGGVKSGVHTKEATWISYSFDVKLEGKGACRHTDKMLMNHGNTACLSGLDQIVQQMFTMGEIQVLCKLLCDCIAAGDPHQSCVAKKLDAADNATGGLSPAKAEVPFDMRRGPTPLPEPWVGTEYQLVRMLVKGGTTPAGAARRAAPDLGRVLKGQIRIPDVVLVNDPLRAPSGTNLAGIVEMKMPGDATFADSKVLAQLDDYADIAAGNNPSAVVSKLDATTCGCKPNTPEPVLVPDLVKENERLKDRFKFRFPKLPEPVFAPATSRALPVIIGGLALLALAGLAWATGVGAPVGALVGGLAVGVLVGSGAPPLNASAFKT
jgi:hypothetical protein